MPLCIAGPFFIYHTFHINSLKIPSYLYILPYFLYLAIFLRICFSLKLKYNSMHLLTIHIRTIPESISIIYHIRTHILFMRQIPFRFLSAEKCIFIVKTNFTLYRNSCSEFLFLSVVFPLSPNTHGVVRVNFLHLLLI